MSENEASAAATRGVADPAWAGWFDRQSAEAFWCLGQPEILDRYAGQVVALHHRLVLGSGANQVEALAAARRRAEEAGVPLPRTEEVLFVPIPESVAADPDFFPAPPGGG